MKRAIIVSLLSLASAGVAHAQPFADRAELRRDHRELRQDRRELDDDWRDVQRLEWLLRQFDAARMARDGRALSALDAELRGLVNGEYRESNWELAHDRAELARDTRLPYGYEWRSRDRRDAYRDWNDDVRDAATERAELARVGAISNELQWLAGRLDGAALFRRRALTVELIGLARAELANDRRGWREDSHEEREDWHEERGDCHHLRDDVRG